MKKAIILLVIITVIIGFIGCEDEGDGALGANQIRFTYEISSV